MRGLFIVLLAMAASTLTANAQETTGRDADNTASAAVAPVRVANRVAKKGKKKKKQESKAAAAEQKSMVKVAVAEPALGSTGAMANGMSMSASSGATSGPMIASINPPIEVKGGSSTTNLPAAADQAKKRTVKGEFYNFTTISASDFKDKSGAPESANYVGVKKVLSAGQSVSVRQPFSYAFPKTGQKGVAKVKDMYVSYTNSKVATFGKNDAGNITGIGRIYLPTGETSRFENKANGSLFTWWITTYSIGKVDLALHAYGSWVNNTQNTYLKENADTHAMEPSANLDYTYTPFAEVDWNISDKLVFSQSVGTDNAIYRPLASGKVKEVHNFSAMTAVTYSPIPEIGLTVGISDDISIKAPKHPFKLLRDDEITYLFLMTASI